MSDLISRSKLIKVVEADINRCYQMRIDGVGALSHFVDQINNEPPVEAVPVVHCKDCIWWEGEHVLFSDGAKRPYTEEEKKNCPIGVTADIGINVGSKCMENPHITTLFRNANDYCSRAVRKQVGGQNET